MSRRRTAIVTAGVAAGALAGGVVGRTLRARRRPAPESDDLSRLPEEELGPVLSFDGTEIAVRAAGDPSGPGLVFIHGFSLDMTTWHEQWTALSERFRCVLFDQRAHGRSGRPPGRDYSVSATGRDLSAVLDVVAPRDPVVLVGHSMGGMTILAMAEQRPEAFGTRVAGAVFVGASASDLVRGALSSAGARIRGLVWPRVPSILAAVRRVDGLRRQVTAGASGIDHLIARLTNFGPDAPRALVDHVADLSARAPVRVWTDGLASLVDTDLRHAARHVTVPSVVVVGEVDRVTPPSVAKTLSGLLPNARLEIVNGAGHMTMMERPEAFNRAVADLAHRVLPVRRRRPVRKAAAPEDDG